MEPRLQSHSLLLILSDTIFIAPIFSVSYVDLSRTYSYLQDSDNGGNTDRGEERHHHIDDSHSISSTVLTLGLTWQELSPARMIFEIPHIRDLVIAHIRDRSELKKMTCISKDCLPAAIRGLWRKTMDTKLKKVIAIAPVSQPPSVVQSKD
jgi:hypothetical protein